MVNGRQSAVNGVLLTDNRGLSTFLSIHCNNLLSLRVSTLKSTKTKMHDHE
jgi:hypothetical protein